MSDSNTGKPDMSDAEKAFNAGVEEYEALHKENSNAIETYKKAYDTTIARYTKAKSEHDAIIAERKPASDALFNGYSSELYNAGFRAQIDAQNKVADALKALIGGMKD
jgi:hypothetical protein